MCSSLSNKQLRNAARVHRVLLPDLRITASNLASTFNQELDDRRQPVNEHYPQPHIASCTRTYLPHRNSPKDKTTMTSAVLPASSQPPQPSSLTTLTSSTAISPTTPLSAATLQVLHNLQHQHLWTSLQIHSLPPPLSSTQAQTQTQIPTFIISGIPPTRVYTHPDEQLFMLERGLREGDIDPERTFVLPTVKGQSWSLRKMAAVFDSLPQVDEALASLAGGLEGDDDQKDGKEAKVAEYLEYRETARVTKEWGGKRMLLAMVDKGMGGEGTVVYYVVQEGAVKPRQN